MGWVYIWERERGGGERESIERWGRKCHSNMRRTFRTWPWRCVRLAGPWPRGCLCVPSLPPCLPCSTSGFEDCGMGAWMAGLLQGVRTGSETQTQIRTDPKLPPTDLDGCLYLEGFTWCRQVKRWGLLNLTVPLSLSSQLDEHSHRAFQITSMVNKLIVSVCDNDQNISCSSQRFGRLPATVCFVEQEHTLKVWLCRTNMISILFQIPFTSDEEISK